TMMQTVLNEYGNSEIQLVKIILISRKPAMKGSVEMLNCLTNLNSIYHRCKKVQRLPLNLNQIRFPAHKAISSGPLLPQMTGGNAPEIPPMIYSKIVLP
ncbi:MAG TPA: hypothetical protein VFK37_03785, partial [Bacillales bacterium]|nr:hypothetical protein [Bacillales bacterium]